MAPSIWSFHFSPLSLGTPVASYTPVCARLPRNIVAFWANAALANHKTARRDDRTRTFLGGRSDLKDNLAPDFKPAAVYPGKDRVGFAIAVGIEVGIGERSTHLGKTAEVDINPGCAAILTIHDVVGGGASFQGKSLLDFEVLQ